MLIQEIHLKNVVCEIAAILSRPQCVENGMRGASEMTHEIKEYNELVNVWKSLMSFQKDFADTTHALNKYGPVH